MKKIISLSIVICLLSTNTISQTKSKNLVSNGFELTMDSKSCCENAKLLHLIPRLFDVGYKINNATINGINFSTIFLVFFENKLWNIDYITTNPEEGIKIQKIVFEKYGLNNAIKDSLSEKNNMDYYWIFNNQKICLSINNIDFRYDLLYYDLDLKEKFYLKQKDNL